MVLSSGAPFASGDCPHTDTLPAVAFQGSPSSLSHPSLPAGYSNFDDDKFSGLLERLFPALSDLILTDRREVRDILRSIHRRVGALTGICPAD